MRLAPSDILGSVTCISYVCSLVLAPSSTNKEDWEKRGHQESKHSTISQVMQNKSDAVREFIALLVGQTAESQESSGEMRIDNEQLELSRGENEHARVTTTELRDKANTEFDEEKAYTEAATEQMN